MLTEPIMRLKEISRIYKAGTVSVPALVDIDLEVMPGEMIAIMGPSGSGKSTFLNLIGCLDRPTRGSYELAGTQVSKMSDDRLAMIRNQQLGFIFQSYNLLQQLTALQNVELPLIYRRVPASKRRERAQAALEAVGLGPRVGHKPAELSGGEQQRVGIARALVGDPVMLLADEPTGNLDTRSGYQIIQLFQDLNASGRTIVMVTHSQAIARHCGRIVRLRDGRLEADETVTDPLSAREELENLPDSPGPEEVSA